MVTYEWVIEPVDEYGDIKQVCHAGTFKKALEYAAHFRAEGEQRVEIGLVRDTWNDIDEDLDDRQWAYLEDGKLPVKFDGGAKVPQRFIQEVK